MKKRIADFIKDNKVLTLSCLDEHNKPYCFHCFYAFDEENYLLFFKSSTQAFHSSLLAQNPQVAGGILPDNIEYLALKGVQLTAKVLYNDIPCGIHADDFYHKKFPFALARPGHVWCLQLESVKMTDNTHVFGKKLIWNKDAELV